MNVEPLPIYIVGKETNIDADVTGGADSFCRGIRGGGLMGFRNHSYLLRDSETL